MRAPLRAGKGCEHDARQHAGGHGQLRRAVPDHPLAPAALAPRALVLATGDPKGLGADLRRRRRVLGILGEQPREVQGDELGGRADLEAEKRLDGGHLSPCSRGLLLCA